MWLRHNFWSIFFILFFLVCQQFPSQTLWPVRWCTGVWPLTLTLSRLLNTLLCNIRCKAWLQYSVQSLAQYFGCNIQCNILEDFHCSWLNHCHNAASELQRIVWRGQETWEGTVQQPKGSLLSELPQRIAILHTANVTTSELKYCTASGCNTNSKSQ